MCNFLSVIVLRSGEILHHPMLDSHTDIQRWFRKHPHLEHALRDEDRLERFARVEFTPADDTWFEPQKWALKIDEEIKPGWWDETMESQTRKRLVSLVQTMTIFDAEHDFIIEGCWIVGGKSVVKDVRGGRLITVRGSATVRDVWGSATVSGVRDSATVRDVWGSATVSGVRGSATVSGVRGSATVSDVGDSATVSDVGPKVTLDESAKAAVVKKAGSA